MLRLSDEQWERIREHFPEKNIPEGRAGRKPVPAREVLEAVLWILDTGAQWHMLPQCYPNYKTVHRRSVLRDDRNSLAKSLGALKTFRYLYDFGDGWEHKIRIEKILPLDPAVRLPLCLAGANACPPEDVGGLPGYVDFVEAISDPRHDEHEAMLEWCGGSFDPYAFDLDAVNADLAQIKL